MRYFLSPLVFALGILLMRYTVQVTNITGKIDFAEKYLTTGLAGTYTFWRLFGLGLCIIAVLWFLNLLPHSNLVSPGQ